MCKNIPVAGFVQLVMFLANVSARHFTCTQEATSLHWHYDLIMYYVFWIKKKHLPLRCQQLTTIPMP